MPKTDKRVDAYLAKSAEFAQPILRELRAIIHAGCPEATETIKWGMPFFEYKGPMCYLAAFKHHCAFGFWRGTNAMEDPAKSDEAMGQLGRITSVKELPPKRVLLQCLKKAMQSKDAAAGAPARSSPRPPRKEVAVPAYFTAALKKNKKAFATFEAFTPGKRKDYVEWITEAKTEETRERRIKTSLEWLAEGKSRNWKYERC